MTKKEYAEVCNDFSHCPGVPIDRGKFCLACLNYYQTDPKVWDSWKCCIPAQEIRRKAHIEAQVKGQTRLIGYVC